MEDFLPLLIGVFWLAYTLYNKGQKKKAREGSPEGETKAPVASFIEEFLLGKQENPSVPFYAEETETIPIDDLPGETKPIEIFQKSVSKPIISSELESFTIEGQHAFSAEELIDEYVNDSGNIVFNEEFNLRKAVIYSEILNAPYI
jgi:hypothetical protein